MSVATSLFNKITHYFKKFTTGSGVFKKIYCLDKNVMLQIDPLKSTCSQKQQYPERTLRLKVLRKSSSLEKVAIPKVTLASAPLEKKSALNRSIYAIYGYKNSSKNKRIH